jgi:hypothetical protein
LYSLNKQAIVVLYSSFGFAELRFAPVLLTPKETKQRKSAGNDNFSLFLRLLHRLLLCRATKKAASSHSFPVGFLGGFSFVL